MSNTGKIHDGACLEPNIAQATICGERHAIANMVLDEAYKAKIKHTVVADPVPEVQKIALLLAVHAGTLFGNLAHPKPLLSVCNTFNKKTDGFPLS